MSITILLIVITVIVSIVAFNNKTLMDKLIFYPPAVSERKEYYRFVTCGFIHADIPHLIFNMYAFYLFGQGVERSFLLIFGDAGKLLYVLMYLLALVVCLVPTFKKHKGNYYYRSLGASGAVSAVVFAFIFLDPLTGVGLIFIPVFIPGFLFAIIYLVISYFMGRSGRGHINHSAHIWGSLFGIVYLIIACNLFSNYGVVNDFIDKVRHLDPNKIFMMG